MATEKGNVDISTPLNALMSLGAVRTELVFIQEDETDLFYCKSVLRGWDAKGVQLEDQLACPPPCTLSQAFNPNA